MFALHNSPVRYSLYISEHFIFNIQIPSYIGIIGYYDREKAREVAIALSQTMISFHKGVALRRGRQKTKKKINIIY
jgi:hypothetical protein